MIRKLLLGLTLAAFLTGGSVSAFEAVGSSFGTLTTAQAMGQGKGAFGFAVGVADQTSFVGTFGFGLSQYSDGRLKLGLTDPDGGDAQVTFGADYKWQFWNHGGGNNNPFDAAVGLMLEYVDFDNVSVFQFGGQVLASYPIQLTRGGVLSPYGRFNARVEWLSWDRPVGWEGDDSESNLEVGLNGGVQWQMSSTVASYLEFQIDGNDGLFFGIDLMVM